jgi:hypothetical protein
MGEDKVAGGNDYIFHMMECVKCKRKILVERFLIGVSHTSNIVVTCAECLGVIHPSFRKDHPEAADKIERWVHDYEQESKD